MKINHLKTKLCTGILALIFIAGIETLYAQPGSDEAHGKMDKKEKCEMAPEAGICHNIPNLTEEQQQKITKLQTGMMKEMQGIHDQLAEKHAHLKTLSHAEKPDQNAINKTIDEISDLQAQMMKKRFSHRQEIRNILTNEQKVVFDTKPFEKNGCCKSDKRHHKKMKECSMMDQPPMNE